MIHTYKLNGYNIALDVNSGAVHILDELSYDILKYLKNEIPQEIDKDIICKLNAKYNEDDIRDAYSELYALYEQGQLFSKDCYEKYAEMMINSPVKSMCLNVAHDCNLRCEYCFAAKGDFGTGRELMPLDIAKKAIDFMIANSGTRHNLEVDFFGGEPLMNFDVVRETVKYARSIEGYHNKNFRFTITTNGLLLDNEKIDFINQEMSNVVLSLDGRKEVNDKLRVTPNQKGSYNAIVPKYQQLVATRCDKDYYVRGTFTKHNLDFTKDVLHMADLGFDQLSIEPVVSDPLLSYSIKEEDLPAVFAEYETLAKEIIKRKKEGKCFNFFHFMLDLNQGPCAIKRLRGCSCGNEYIAITPNGDIFPCHQFVGNDEFKMGNLNEGTFNTLMKTQFSKANIYSKSDCKNCWAKFYCSGGCNANNHKYAGSILKPHKTGCDLEKKRLECAIMIQAALADEKD